MKLHILTDLLERLGMTSAARQTRETQAAKGDTSIDQLFGDLHSLIRAVEPAFEGILDIFLDSSTVVYAVSPEGDTELFRRKFTQGDTVGLSDKREQVQLKREFVPLEGVADPKPEGASTPAEPAKAKADDGAQAPAPTRPPGAPAKAAEPTKADDGSAQASGDGGTPEPAKVTKADLVGAMIASPDTTFTVKDVDILSGFSDELLIRLASDLACGCPVPTKAEGADAAGKTPEPPEPAEGAGDGEGAVDDGPVTPVAPAAHAAADPPKPITVAVHLDGEKIADIVGSKLVSKPQTPNPSGKGSSSGQGATTMHTNRAKDLALRLIACEESPFTEPDYDQILGFTEERLYELVQSYTPDNPPPASFEDWMETAPEDVRNMVRRYQAEDAQRRAELVLAITASQDEYTKEQLSCMQTHELERLGKALGLHKRFDYSGRGMPRDGAALSAFGQVAEAPDSYAIALEKREAATTH
jgi:hypothetical protein